MLFTFTQAKPDELATVVEILNEAAAWLHQRHIRQWPEAFGSDDWRTARISRYITDQNTWLVKADTEPIATFSLTPTADPDYADGWPTGPEDALYIFRMAVRRAWSGNDLGGRILDWASSRALALGYHHLRLDCHRYNTSLQRYYERHAFRRVGTVVRTIDDNGQPYTRTSGALYDRPAGSIHQPKETTMPQTYDPTGEADIWQRAANMVASLKREPDPNDEINSWNTALEQASRALENEARGIRQREGMYYRVITGTENYQPLTSDPEPE